MATYKVKDLMINVMPVKAGGGGSVSYPAPDSDTSEFPSPITPVISVALYAHKLRFIESYKGKVEKLNPQLVENVAVKLGRVAMGGMLTALCAEDQATCDGQVHSPIAMEGGGLQLSDLVHVKGLLNEAVAQIEGIEAVAASRAQADAGDLLPKIEATLETLKPKGKR